MPVVMGHTTHAAYDEELELPLAKDLEMSEIGHDGRVSGGAGRIARPCLP
jgi:hypothetical protein